jgi:hypothetical protein
VDYGDGKPKPKLEREVSYLNARIRGMELSMPYSFSTWKACPKNWNTNPYRINRQMCGLAKSSGKNRN